MSKIADLNEWINWLSCRGVFRTVRSSHRKCSLKKVVLRNFTKFTGKHLCQKLFFNIVAGLQLYWQRGSGTGVSCEFCEISKNTFSTEHLRTTASELCQISRMVHFARIGNGFQTLTVFAKRSILDARQFWIPLRQREITNRLGKVQQR